MRFDYYEHLGARQKATYRRSDAVGRIEIPEPTALAPMLETMRLALEADNRSALGRATSALCRATLAQLQVSPVTVRVLARRPSDEASELHGLYVREEEGPPVIRLWMRTAAHVRPVRFRTFVRTFAHELLHHLDFEILKLEDTFHTEGFFRRESDLVKQLLGERRRPEQTAIPQAPRPARKRSRGAVQLTLFGQQDRRSSKE